MLLNRPRAIEIMERAGADALVAQQPLNVYYLTDYWGEMVPALWDALYFAVVPRREEVPAAIVAPSMEMLFVDKTTWVSNRVYCTAPLPGDAMAPGSAEPAAIPFPGFPVRSGAAVTALDARKLARVRQYGERTAAGTVWGLARALRDAGLVRATVIADDARIGAWLPAHGLGEVRVLVRPDLFNEIRLVKSAAEIELLRTAAGINERACLAAAQSIRAGATEDEVARTYLTEMARQGGRGTYLVTSLGGLPHGHFVAGEPVMLDALGTFRQYHGDIGRTAVIGEPPADLLRRNRAVQAGWQAACELMRPGVRYSEVSTALLAAVHGAGFPEFGIVQPHAVGLQHTDDPSPPGYPPGFKADRALEENMVLNLDLPHEELGWGTAHIEDTVRITRDGVELLTSAAMDVIRLPS
ncbi:MAG: aminopeptidase P family protein [Gammaproteobacteria bacterium]|nr:aminopeptidase P family protein [Gammaproteobacteria bacterium]